MQQSLCLTRKGLSGLLSGISGKQVQMRRAGNLAPIINPMLCHFEMGARNQRTYPDQERTWS